MLVQVPHFAVLSSIIEIPDSQSLVVADGYQEPAVVVEAEVSDPVVVAFKRNHARAAARVPNFDCLVPRPTR